MTISCAILTGGLSRRMGTDKALLPLGRNPMAMVIAGILERVTGSTPFLVSKCPRKYEHLSLPVVRDAMPYRCALAGIHAALRHARTSRVLITTCDQPFLSEPLLREMVRSAGDVVVCEVDRTLASFPVIFSTDLLEAIADSFSYGVLSVQKNMFVAGFPTILEERRVRRIDPELRTFQNLNNRPAFEQAVSTTSSFVLK